MFERFRMFAAVTLLTGIVTPALEAAQRPSNPCTARDGRELQLQPRDDAAQRADFLMFRRRLQEAAARRDVDAILRVLDPHVKVAFDGAGGIEAFKAYHINDPEVDFWKEFATILALGGTFRTPDAFDAPYTFSAWPEDADAFECLAVVGDGVRLRAGAGTTARIIKTLNYPIVRALASERRTEGWQLVQLAGGRRGYVASKYLRSPVGYRALFEFKNGQWWLVAYVAGD